MKKIFLLSLVLLSAAVLSGGTLTTSGGTPVNYRPGADANRNFMDFLGRLEAEASRAAKYSAAGGDGRVRIEVDKVEPEGHINILRIGNSAVIVIGGDLDRYVANRSDARFFAAVFLLSRLNIPPERGLGAFPAFVADGLCSRAENAGKKRVVLLNTAQYPGIRSVLSSGGKVGLRGALRGITVPEPGAPGAFYDENARIGLDILMSGITAKNNPVAVMVRELAASGNFDTAFDAAFGPVVGVTPGAAAAFDPPAAIDARLERLIRRRVFTQFAPYRAAEQSVMLAAVRNCTYYEEDCDEPRQADLSELPLLIERRVDSCRIVLNNKQRALTELIAGAGPITIGDLETVLELIGKVGDMPAAECSAQLAAALGNSEQAIAKLSAIEKELDDVENSLVSEQQRFPWRFSTVCRGDSDLPSGVTAELDRVQKLLEKP